MFSLFYVGEYYVVVSDEGRSYENDETCHLNIHEMLFSRVARPFHHHPNVTLPDTCSLRPDPSHRPFTINLVRVAGRPFHVN